MGLFKKTEYQIIHEKLLLWSKQQGAIIHFASLALSSDFTSLIVYKTDNDLKHNLESGLTERTKEAFVKLVEEVKGSCDFVVNFEFDSHENVKRTHNGNYFHRCRD